MKLKDRKSDYICRKCAEDNGGVWPKGHCATMHTGICGMCGGEYSLANVGDWDWPNNKKIGMRD